MTHCFGILCVRLACRRQRERADQDRQATASTLPALWGYLGARPQEQVGHFHAFNPARVYVLTLRVSVVCVCAPSRDTRVHTRSSVCG